MVFARRATAGTGFVEAGGPMLGSAQCDDTRGGRPATVDAVPADSRSTRARDRMGTERRQP